MLNFSSIKSQINKMIEEKKGVEERFLEKINLAHSELKLKSKSWEELSRKVNLSDIPGQARSASLLPDKHRLRGS